MCGCDSGVFVSIWNEFGELKARREFKCVRNTQTTQQSEESQTKHTAKMASIVDDKTDENDTPANPAGSSCLTDPNFAVICEFLQKFALHLKIEHPDFAEMQKMIENSDEGRSRIRFRRVLFLLLSVGRSICIFTSRRTVVVVGGGLYASLSRLF